MFFGVVSAAESVSRRSALPWPLPVVAYHSSMTRAVAPKRKREFQTKPNGLRPLLPRATVLTSVGRCTLRRGTRHARAVADLVEQTTDGLASWLEPAQELPEH